MYIVVISPPPLLTMDTYLPVSAADPKINVQNQVYTAATVKSNMANMGDYSLASC